MVDENNGQVPPSEIFLEAGWPAAEEALACLRSKTPDTLIHGLPGSARAFFLAWAYRRLGEKPPWIVITSTREEAINLQGDLAAWLPEVCVRSCPSWEVLPLDVEEPDPELVGERLRSFLHLQNNDPGILVAPLSGALQGTLAPGDWLDRLFIIRRGSDLPANLEERLVALGFTRVTQVVEAGQFAVRGGLVDLAPPGSPSGPVRLDRSGDRVESIRRLDLASQRSSGDVDEVIVFPPREVLMTEPIRRAVASRLRGKTKGESLWARMADELFRTTGRFPGWEWQALGAASLSDAQATLRQGRAPCLWDYLPPDARLIVLEPAAVASRAVEFHERIGEWEAQAKEEGSDLFRVRDMFGDGDALKGSLGKGTAAGVGFLEQDLYGKPARGATEVPGRALPPYYGKFASFASDLKSWRRDGLEVLLFCHNRGEKERLGELLKEHDLTDPGVHLQVGEIEQGFAVDDLRLVCLPDHDLFRRYRGSKHPRRHRAISGGRPLSSLSELTLGGLAVHVDHGLCLYRGLTPLTVDGVTKDYIQLEFADSEKNYLPTDQIALVQKYVGGEAAPALSKLGGEQWKRTKERVRLQAAGVARELVALYQTRSVLKKRPLPPDTPWQAEFEDAFLYEITPGQDKAVRDVKRDMESEKPMDRLVCGDVGYGKTEVAMRAAFKAVQDARQVAVLVPTTVLAQQHSATFQERMAEYPVRISTLSRFKEKKEQKAILEAAASGGVDILIGTHRLLMKDVRFKRLGLLIVDEEHRFGVAQKERLKHLKKDVDVLTLTATPIPRTLHMALSGIREISVIDTPPRNRLSVVTHIGPFNPRLAAEAVRREMNREGQVFYVHNHVRDIERVAGVLHERVPEARLAVAHGQLTEHELESIMMDFVDGEFDVLVCTSIIESGLDMPRVNTLVVERSDAFGLSQLYQLKGRVGRTDRQAYAYFFHSRKASLREIARKRLEALQEFKALGSGMHIAMRDMEIRGAGNLLGLQQHGNMDAVGFDLFSRMLTEEIAEARGEEVLEEFNPTLSLSVTAFFPRDYIEEEIVKVDFYRRLVEVDSREKVVEIGRELVDRFGPLPKEASSLLKVASLRPSMRLHGIQRLEEAGGWVSLTWHEARTPGAGTVAGWMRRIPPSRIRFDPQDKNTVSFRIIKANEPEDARLDAVENLLRELS